MGNVQEAILHTPVYYKLYVTLHYDAASSTTAKSREILARISRDSQDTKSQELIIKLFLIKLSKEFYQSKALVRVLRNSGEGPSRGSVHETLVRLRNKLSRDSHETCLTMSNNEDPPGTSLNFQIVL